MKRTSFGLQLGEEPGERSLVLDRGTRRDVDRDAHLARDDVRERGFAEAGRTAKKNVIEGLFSPARGLDEDAEIALVLLLADVFVERRRPKEPIETGVVSLLASGDGPLGWLEGGARATRTMLRLTLGSRCRFLHGSGRETSPF